MQERARQMVRERQRLEEAREEAVLQGLRRSERGRQPKKRSPASFDWLMKELATISGCLAFGRYKDVYYLTV
jgi:hypothetical protein